MRNSFNSHDELCGSYQFNYSSICVCGLEGVQVALQCFSLLPEGEIKRALTIYTITFSLVYVKNYFSEAVIQTLDLESVRRGIRR